MKHLNPEPESVAKLPRRSIVLGAGALLALAGCQSTKVDGGAAAWNPVPMQDADVVPANLDPSRRARVVVLPSDESPSARGAGLAEVASAALESALGTGGVEIVDRKLANRLDQELRLAEMQSTGKSYAGPEVADYAIRVVMGTAGWRSTFVAASSYKNPLNGQMVNVPASYTHAGSSNMTLRIYTLPELKLVESIPVEGSVTVTSQNSPATNAHAAGLMRSATDAGIKSKRAQVINEFAPKGYITERRVKGDKSIFRVQLGKNTGAKAGNKVEIWTQQKVGSSFDEVSLGTGVMSDIVGTEGSWILVDDAKRAARVRKYDFVKVKAGGFLDSLGLPF
jgi:hypothetical protein